MNSFRIQVLETDVLQQLSQNNFVENCLDILVDFCNAKDYQQTFQSNIAISLLERRSEFEVRVKKGGAVSLTQSQFSHQPPPTASLIIAIADAFHNFSAFSNSPVQVWNEQGLYRLLFRCCSWSCKNVHDTQKVRAATCRALSAVTSHKCVRAALARTKDCLHNLLLTLTPIVQDDVERDSLEARAQALSLLASLVTDQSAADNVWDSLRDINATDFFCLILQCLESDEIELQDAALYCLTELTQSIKNKRHVDKSKDKSCLELYDHIKSPFWDAGNNEKIGAGDSARRRDCQPEFIAEEICKALIDMYQKLSMDSKQQLASKDDRWIRVSACLSSVLCTSVRSRQYAVHRQLPCSVLGVLRVLRDQLSLHDKPADVIRNTNNDPILRTLLYILTLIDCCMINCSEAKETFAEENIATYLIKLWPWCMMTEQLRNAVVHLLYTFTNNCPKAHGCMCVCVAGRTLAGELCAAAARGAQRAGRPSARDATLLCTLHTLAALADHQHCRAIILKSSCISSMLRVCVRVRGLAREARGAGGAGLARGWARLCGAAARHADGAAAVLALRSAAPLPAPLPAPVAALLLPAIAHAAHHHRQTFLQSPDLLELLCDTLLAGDTAEIISATRALWALAANNHKAKLVLRSAGAISAVHTCLQRLHKMSADEDIQKAIQLLTYTNTVLQTT